MPGAGVGGTGGGGVGAAHTFFVHVVPTALLTLKEKTSIMNHGIMKFSSIARYNES